MHAPRSGKILVHAWARSSTDDLALYDEVTQNYSGESQVALCPHARTRKLKVLEL